jgi:hypothetical protein
MNRLNTILDRTEPETLSALKVRHKEIILSQA